MRPRILNLSILFQRSLRTPNPFRPFSHIRSSPTRPQLPFQLAFLPTHRAQHPVRFITTKELVTDGVTLTAKIAGCIIALTILSHFFFYGVQNEYFERIYPTPPEWTYFARTYLRTCQWLLENDDPPEWYSIGKSLLKVIKKLEDPKIDGAEVKELDGVETGLDITAKSEEWRQGYYGTLMLTAKVAEYLDSWVVDTTRNLPFAANTVIGPSNTNRKPIPADSPPPALEENCVKAFDPPEMYYTKILTTKGFTPKQKLDATLAYASWLDFKGPPSEASEMYERALDMALSMNPHAAQVLDRKTHILKAGVESDPVKVDSNVLRATTAIALYHARNGSASAALPMFLSILRARRSLPDEPVTMRSSLFPDHIPPRGMMDGVRDFVYSALRIIIPSTNYPIDKDDGTGRLVRDSKEMCEEAALMTYIGEILYASPSSASSENAIMTARENGLAWTREAVDIAEECFVYCLRTAQDQKSRKACRLCLETGLDNWAQMIRILVEDEKAKAEKDKEKPQSWFGGKNAVAMIGRWESEDAVVKERIRRARLLLKNDEKDPEEALKYNKNAFGGTLRGWLLP